jgi:hypothetical protein
VFGLDGLPVFGYLAFSEEDPPKTVLGRLSNTTAHRMKGLIQLAGRKCMGDTMHNIWGGINFL